jgi:hypothetical protein
VSASSHTRAAPVILVAALAGLGALGCPGSAGIGEPCASSGDCDRELQCLEGYCTPACRLHVECGDGYQCDRGECVLVDSALGDPCDREIDCGPGQRCALDPADTDGDGWLSGSCQLQLPGMVTGAACRQDGDCQSGLCVIGVCSQMCGVTSDCVPGQTCAIVPRLLPDSAPTFSGCLPASGVAVERLTLTEPSASLRVPVPSTARSFALVTRVDDRNQLVGATRVIAPDGRLLFSNPRTPAEYYGNPLRYQPEFSTSTLLVSNTPAVELQLGAYQIDVSSLLPFGGTGTVVPQVEVLYKLDTGAALDLHIHVLDLTAHPCAGSFDGGRLDALAAPASPRFQGYLAAIDGILEAAGVRIGQVTYRDITDRGDLDAIRREQLGDLLELSTGATGLNVFLVRSIAPVGVQALVGGTPGPPRRPGTTASGVVISMDTLCYRSWDVLARVTTHALARHMGLFFNRAPDGALDTIPDSDESPANLMFFGEFGGTLLSAGQRDVLRRYPGLR